MKTKSSEKIEVYIPVKEHSFSTITPWGPSHGTTELAKGVLSVSTAGHGGLMVDTAFARKHMTVAAQKRGMRYSTFLCYEEDCDWNIVAWELRELWPALFNYSKPITDAEREADIIKALSVYHADYLLEIDVEPEPEGYRRYLAMQNSEKLRKEKSPDLIVSAIMPEDKVLARIATQVMTADGQEHLVTRESYRTVLTRDWPCPLLSSCELYEVVEPAAEPTAVLVEVADAHTG